jgi:hypothetical protein
MPQTKPAPTRHSFLGPQSMAEGSCFWAEGSARWSGFGQLGPQAHGLPPPAAGLLPCIHAPKTWVLFPDSQKAMGRVCCFSKRLESANPYLSNLDKALEASLQVLYLRDGVSGKDQIPKPGDSDGTQQPQQGPSYEVCTGWVGSRLWCCLSLQPAEASVQGPVVWTCWQPAVPACMLGPGPPLCAFRT